MPQDANVQNDGKGIAGHWRRRDVTKARLAYMVCDARRTVNRRAKVGDETLANVRKVRVPACTKDPVLKLTVCENAFGSQPDPHPVTRQLPRNHLSLPVKGRRAWDATGQVGQTGRSSRWRTVHSGSMGKPCAGRRARDIAVQCGNTYRGVRPRFGCYCQTGYLRIS
jgi:hypothetical protein